MTITAAVRPAVRPLRRYVLVGLVGALVIVVAVAGVLAQGAGNARTLDPDGTSPNGSGALAVLLGQRGVEVDRVTTVAAATAAAGTVFVPQPARLSAADLTRLRSAAAAVVAVAPAAEAVRALAPGAAVRGQSPVRSRPPSCDLPAASLAGSASLGGTSYAATQPAAACYPAAGGATLLRLAGPGATVTLVGTPAPFMNGALGDDGNAALALGLLDTGPRVEWLLPPVGAAAGSSPGLVGLLPDRLLAALAQLALAVALLALWRARRLGPVVAEPLPVVVRAAETVEGRGRLYRATRARASAVDALRSGARARLAPRLGLAPDAAAPALVDAVARRTAREPTAVADLLYGAPTGRPGPAVPADDAALVRLAGDLDTLEAEVRRR